MTETEAQATSSAPQGASTSGSRPRPHGGHPSARDYIRIAVVLFGITLAEVSTYYINPPRGIMIPVLLMFTVIKFSLVVLWFMHLKFDSRVYARLFVMGLAFAFTLYFIVLLLFGVF